MEKEEKEEMVSISKQPAPLKGLQYNAAEQDEWPSAFVSQRTFNIRGTRASISAIITESLTIVATSGQVKYPMSGTSQTKERFN